jgi:D-aminopeptidase
VQIADATAEIPPVEQIGESKIVFTSQTMTDAMKMFKIVWVIASTTRGEVYK